MVRHSRYSKLERRVYFFEAPTVAINYATRSPQVRRGTSSAWLRRSPHADQEVVGRRIGRHIGGCPAPAAFLVAEVIRDPDGKAGC